jgi:CCR4-NOT transcription complex subunit 3
MLTQNEYERYLAANELRKREWRFHKSFGTWFKRMKQPNQITETYETGDVWMFDARGDFKIAERQNFTFEFQHLEEEMPE